MENILYKIIFSKILLIWNLFLLSGCQDNSIDIVRVWDKQIETFIIESHALVGKIVNINKSVHLKITPDIDRTNLVPTIEVSEGAAISPQSGIVRDFTDTLTYTVIAHDGSSIDYHVNSSVGNYILNSCYHIVHMQKHFIYSVGIHNSNQVISSIKQILELAREEKIPIVFSKSQPAGDREIIDELKPRTNETVIESSSDDPIIEEMKKLEVKTVVVVGIFTDACVKDICTKLNQAGFEVILVSDATSVSRSKHIDLINETCQELEQNGIVTLRTTDSVLF